MTEAAHGLLVFELVVLSPFLFQGVCGIILLALKIFDR